MSCSEEGLLYATELVVGKELLVSTLTCAAASCPASIGGFSEVMTATKGRRSVTTLGSFRSATSDGNGVFPNYQVTVVDRNRDNTRSGFGVNYVLSYVSLFPLFPWRRSLPQSQCSHQRMCLALVLARIAMIRRLRINMLIRCL